jgi:GWxTD domain-containing protein
MDKRGLFVIIVLMWIGNLAFAQSEIPAPRVLFAVENFYHPADGSYIELYLSFDASSLKYEKKEDYHQARLEVLYVIKKNNTVIKYQKFEVLSPKMSSGTNRQDFADVQTMTLKPDEYTVEITVWDANRDIEPIKATQPLVVNLKAKEMGMSDFMFEKSIENSDKEGPFVKNGVAMTPWLVTTIPSFMDYIYLYAEVYNSDYELGANGAYIEKHTLRSLDVDSVFESYSAVKRVKAEEVNIILKKIDLKSLPQGSYSYTIELFNRENELVGSNGKQFYRESEIEELRNIVIASSVVDFEALIRSTTNRDSIVDYFRCIRPVGSRVDQNFIDNNDESSTEILQTFVISFWEKYKPENTYVEWMKYRAMVAQVNKEFGSSNRKGYETDQGVVYLQYGAPDQIVNRDNEPSSYPYIIWQYYAHPKQSNAMYVFYDPSLTFRDYQLLHSNVRGEKNNSRWKLILQSRNNANGDVDKDDGVDHWGGRVDDYYTNPR